MPIGVQYPDLRVATRGRSSTYSESLTCVVADLAKELIRNNMVVHLRNLSLLKSATDLGTFSARSWLVVELKALQPLGHLLSSLKSSRVSRLILLRELA